MKTQQKFYIFYIVIIIIIMPSCFKTLHETASNPPKISLREAIDSMKDAIKDTKQNSFFADEKVVRDVAVSEEGFKLINTDNTERYYAFEKIIDPVVVEDHFTHLFFVKFQHIPGRNILFTNSKSAKKFADALYYLKHIDIKREGEKEHEDCLRLVHETPINLILGGATADDLRLPCSGVPRDQIEAILNDILVEWKSKGLRGLLQKSSSSQLNDLVVNMEKGILKLDLKAKQLKDLADEDARQVKAPGAKAPAKQAPAALTLSHLLDQRKTILMVILGSVKQAAAKRATAGG